MTIGTGMARMKPEDPLSGYQIEDRIAIRTGDTHGGTMNCLQRGHLARRDTEITKPLEEPIPETIIPGTKLRTTPLSPSSRRAIPESLGAQQ